MTQRVTKAELTELLHKADGMLTIMHRYRVTPVPEDLRQEMIDTGNECRTMVRRIDNLGIRTGKTLTQEDWDA